MFLFVKKKRKEIYILYLILRSKMTKEFRARLINLWLSDTSSPHPDPSERLCCINSCANTRDSFMYHPLPESGKIKIGELDLKRIWMQNCQIPADSNDNTKYFVCSKHFILSDYSISSKFFFVLLFIKYS